MGNLPAPVPAAQTPGNLITAALWNALVVNGFTFVLNRPAFSGYQTTAQSVPTSSWTSLSIDTELLDSYGGHSNTVNPSRYVPPVAGTYLVIGNTGFATNTTGYRSIRLALNGGVVKGSAMQVPPTSGVTALNTSAFVAVNGTTDYLEVQTWQSAGAALNTNPNTEASPGFRAIWISN